MPVTARCDRISSMSFISYHGCGVYSCLLTCDCLVSQPLSVKPKMDITRFFGKQTSTPTARSVEAKNKCTCVDNTGEDSQCSQSQSGSTPTINKVLFNNITTSISAKKDSAQLKQAQALTNTVESRPPPHAVVHIPPPTVLVQSGSLPQPSNASKAVGSKSL